MTRRYLRGKAPPMDRLLGPQLIEGLMGSRAAAKYLGAAPSSIYRWRDAGWLHPAATEPITMYTKEELDRFRKEHLEG